MLLLSFPIQLWTVASLPPQEKTVTEFSVGSRCFPYYPPILFSIFSLLSYLLLGKMRILAQWSLSPSPKNTAVSTIIPQQIKFQEGKKEKGGVLVISFTLKLLASTDFDPLLVPASFFPDSFLFLRHLQLF